MTLEPGQNLSHYRLVEQIGEGGMGVVWKAVDTKLNRQVALKLLPSHLTGDPERRMRFQREAHAAAALDHPNIATIYETGEHEGVPFISMQLVQGQDIRELLQSGPLALKQWLHIARHIAEGLAHAHSHGVIHRDLKPGNVLVTDDRQVKILDFGLAKILDPGPHADDSSRQMHSQLDTMSRELTRAGKVFGTIAYMSPEQARGDAADHRSDLFSLGVMLYEMASGSLPFKRPSEVESLSATITAEPQSLAEMAPAFPPEVERVVRKAMEKEPDRRYQNAADLVADVRNLQRDLDSGRTSTATATAVRGTGRRRVGLWIGLAVLLAAAATLPWLLRDTPGPGDTVAPVAMAPSVAVIGFQNITDPDDSEHLGRALMGLITTDLAESGGLQVVSSSRVLAALREVGVEPGDPFDPSVAAAAGRAAGAGAMVVGQLTTAGERVLLAAELVDVASGNTLGSVKHEAGSSAELFSLAGAIAAEVRAKLQPDDTADTAELFDLAQALTSVPAAYRHYAAGELSLHQGHWDDASQQFLAALEEDPTFALAGYRASLALWWSGGDYGPVLDAGLAHVGRLPERWQVMYRAFHDAAQGDCDASYARLQTLMAASTDIPDAYYLNSELHFHCSRILDVRKTIEESEKALQLDPTFTVAAYHMAQSYLLADDVDKAVGLLSRFEGSDILEWLEVSVLLRQGQAEAAIARAGELLDESLASYASLAEAYMETGRVDEALALVRRVESSSVEVDRDELANWRAALQIQSGMLQAGLESLRETDTSYMSRFGAGFFHGVVVLQRTLSARLLSAVGREDAAIREMREGLKIDPFVGQAHYTLGRLLLSAGLKSEAADALDRLRSVTGDSSSPPMQFWLHLLQAKVFMEEGDLAAVDTELQAAFRMPREYQNHYAYWQALGQWEYARDNLPAAVAAYRKLVGQQGGVEEAVGQGFSATLVERIVALYQLGVLEEEMGELDSARSSYRRFLDYWGNADLPVPEIADAKNRLAALEGN